MAPERWHLSYAPVAAACERQLTPSLLRETLASSEVRLLDTVLEDLPLIFDRFIINVSEACR